MNQETTGSRKSNTGRPEIKHFTRVQIVSSCVAAAAICGFVFQSRYTALPEETATPAGKILLALCDGTFVAGALLCCAGLLVVVTNEGAFTAATWGFSRLFHRIRNSDDKHSNQHSSPASEETPDDEPDQHRAPGSMSYFEYMQKCKKKKHPAAHLFIVGGVFLALSLILLFFILSHQ